METNKVTDNLKGPFFGVPYILLAKRRYQCHQEENMHKKSKGNYQDKKKEPQTSDHYFIRSRKLSQPMRKRNCPLVFTVKSVAVARMQDPEKDTVKENRNGCQA